MENIVGEFNFIYGQKINQIMDESKRLEKIIEGTVDTMSKLSEENNLLKKQIKEMNLEKKI